MSLPFPSGSATIPGDFDLRNGSLAGITVNNQATRISPPIVNDEISESSEEFTVMLVLSPLTNINDVTIAPDTATVVILDDDCELCATS